MAGYEKPPRPESLRAYSELPVMSRDLADAVVGGEGNVLSSLTRDDLEQLLS